MVRKAALAGVLVGLLAGCGGGRDRGPAWPKPQASETDGGESLAPRQASSVAALEDADDAAPTTATPAPAGGTAATPAAAPAGKPDKPAADAPPPKEPDVLTTEDIIIEIEEE
jgi:hypothetical protein